MKTKHFFAVVGVCSMAGAFSAEGALLGLVPPSGSPYYADFTTEGLDVTYSYNSQTGVGTFHASSKTDPSTGNAYTSGSSSPGTHGSDDATGFSGYFTLDASITRGTGGQWEVSSGTVDIYGQLPGVTTSPSSLLFAGTLKSGVGNFGYGAAGAQEFDFLFTTAAQDSDGNSANSEILQDFFGAGSGQGGIILQTGNYNPLHNYSTLASGFQNLDSGYADTFVPEPAVLPVAASVMAMFGALVIGRKQVRKTSSN